MVTLGFVASILMGLSLGLIGGGGSILTVPILVYLFGVDPVLSTAYSLFIVGSTALVGGGFYLRRGDVDVFTGVLFAVPSFIGVYLTRAYLVPALPDQIYSVPNLFTLTKPLLIMIVFAILMLAASISMIRSKSPTSKTSVGSEISKRSRIILIGFEGLIVGTVTGFVGAGGGFLIIPALVMLVGLPMKKAVGTSLLIIAAKSLIGFVGDLQNQVTLDWKLLWTITGIALVGLFLGTKLNQKVSDSSLKKGFGYFVLIMGTLILLDQVRRMSISV